MKDVETNLVLATLADAVIVADLQERIVYANAAAAALFGWSTSELLGERLFKLMPERMRAAHDGAFHRYVTTRRSSLMGKPIRVPALHRDGHEVDVELTLSLARTSGEDVIVACLRDLRGRVDMEQQLSLARYLKATALAAARMAERLDEEHVARTAAQAAVEVFGAAFAHVWAMGPGSPRLLAAAPDGAAATEAELAPASGAPVAYDVAAIAARRVAMITSSPGDEAALDQAWLEREQVASVAAYPLAVAEDQRGALCCFFRRPLEDEAIEPLGTLAYITSSSLKAARLFEREQAARTAVRASEAWLSTALRSIGEAVIIADTDERVVFMNPSAEDLTDARAASARGRPLDEVLRIIDKDDRGRRLSSAERRRAKWAESSDELVLLSTSGVERQIEQSAAPIRDDDGKHLGEIVVFRDITERRRHEERQSFINAATDLLATSLDYETTLGTVSWLAVPRIADWCGIELLDSPEELRQVALVHVDPAKLSLAREIRRAYPPTPDDASGAFLAVRSGRPILRSNGADDAISAAAPEGLDLRRELQICSSMLVPLIARGRTLGVISFFSAESGRRFGRADLAMAEELAVRAALAVDNARLFQAIQRARDQLDAILRGVDDGITAQDPAGRVIYANEEAARAMGYNSTRAMLTAPLPELFERVEVLDEEGRPVPLEALPGFRALRGRGAPEAASVCFRYRATGEVRWFVMKAAPVFDDNGAAELVITISQDVTERRRNERAERALVNVSAALGESLDHTVTLSKMARIVVPSFAALCFVHLRDDGTIQRVATAHADPTHGEAFLELDRLFPPDLRDPYGPGKVIHTGEPDLVRDSRGFFADLSSHERAREQARLLMRLGIRSLLSVPLAARGRTLGAITFVASPLVASYDERDLAFATELGRRAGLAVDNARLYSETRDAVRARDDFLTVASHELKTPLTSMLLAVQSILRGARRGDDALAPEPLLAKIAIVDRQSQRLAQLIEQLLDISRVTAGRLILELEEFELTELCRTVLARHEDDLRVNGCSIDLRAEAPIKVRWDRARIAQVLTHLLSNAIKFGRGKPIEVEIAADSGRVTLTVRDHGIGVEPVDQGRIFQRFERAVSARHYGGFGMGLWISRRIVEMLGGTIRVESSPAEGSTFTVELPADASAR